METIGYFKEALPEESGISQQTGNTWTKQTFVVETGGNFNADIAFDVWNKKIDLSQFNKMDRLLIKFNIQSHDFLDKNGKTRYSHNVMAYSVTLDGGAVKKQFQKQTPPPEQQMQDVNPQPTDDNLPF